MGANILALLHVSFSLVRSMFSFIAFSGFFPFFYVLVLVHLLGYPFVYCLSLFFLFLVFISGIGRFVVFLCLYSTFSIHHFAVGFFIIAAFFSLPTGSFLFFFFFFACFTFFSLPPTAFVVFLSYGA